MNVDSFIRVGFWTQIILLFLVDWGTVLAFSRMEVAFGHYLGFAVVNVVLVGIAWKMWGWLKNKKSGPPQWVEKAKALELARAQAEAGVGAELPVPAAGEPQTATDEAEE